MNEEKSDGQQGDYERDAFKQFILPDDLGCLDRMKGKAVYQSSYRLREHLSGPRNPVYAKDEASEDAFRARFLLTSLWVHRMLFVNIQNRGGVNLSGN